MNSTTPSATLRAVTLPLVAVATAVALAACSSTAHSPGQGMPGMPGMSSSGPSTTSAPVGPAATGPHNPADVTFATEMIPHHRQAVQMADMAGTRATNAGVKDLATSIKAAQDPEIQAMSGWLTGWGQPVPAASGHDMSQMGTSTSGSSGMGGMGGGMMSDEEMSMLSSASGAQFDTMWLQMMVKHHEGAVTMARAELAGGASTQAKQLAQSIIDSQSKEITTMTTLLGTLGG